MINERATGDANAEGGCWRGVFGAGRRGDKWCREGQRNDAGRRYAERAERSLDGLNPTLSSSTPPGLCHRVVTSVFVHDGSAYVADEMDHRALIEETFAVATSDLPPA